MLFDVYNFRMLYYAHICVDTLIVFINFIPRIGSEGIRRDMGNYQERTGRDERRRLE